LINHASKRGGGIFRKIEDYVNEVVKNLNPRLVILFGSFATGDINEGSDVDILVVADFEKKFIDRVKKLMDINTFRIPIEPIGYTPKEFDEMGKRRNPFIMKVMEKGKVMYKLWHFKSVQA